MILYDKNHAFTKAFSISTFTINWRLLLFITKEIKSDYRDALLSVILIGVLLMVFTAGYTPISMLYEECILFFTGKALAIEPFDTITTVVIMSLAFIFGFKIVCTSILASCIPLERIDDRKLQTMHYWAKKPLEFLKSMTFIVLAEELFARILFLGILVLLLPESTTWFYTLFFCGNLIWATVHVINQKKGQRNVLFTIPQFISGILYTLVFVKYGFLLTMLMHLLSNMVFFFVLLRPLLLKHEKKYEYLLERA